MTGYFQHLDSQRGTRLRPPCQRGTCNNRSRCNRPQQALVPGRAVHEQISRCTDGRRRLSACHMHVLAPARHLPEEAFNVSSTMQRSHRAIQVQNKRACDQPRVSRVQRRTHRAAYTALAVRSACRGGAWRFWSAKATQLRLVRTPRGRGMALGCWPQACGMHRDTIVMRQEDSTTNNRKEAWYVCCAARAFCYVRCAWTVAL
jgi:hypothetical protein